MTKPLVYERFCMFCGKLFMASTLYMENCSTTCRMKSWRSRVMLAGTHGWVNGHWKRFDGPPIGQRVDKPFYDER